MEEGMPQASLELTDRMIARFGDDYLENGPLEYLNACGYRLTPQWEWHKDGITDLRQMTRDELECLLFMAHEWDYGGLAK